MSDEQIARNAADGARLPRLQRTEAAFFEPNVVEAIAAEMSPPNDLLVRILGQLGPRFGEVAALRRRSVDLLRRRLVLDESLAEIGGRLIFGPTKTHATRRIPLTPSLAAALEARLGEIEPDPMALVFTSPRGAPLRYSNFRSQVWRPALDRAAVPAGGGTRAPPLGGRRDDPRGRDGEDGSNGARARIGGVHADRLRAHLRRGSRRPRRASGDPGTGYRRDAARALAVASVPIGLLTCGDSGSGGGTRTHNLRINSPPLCQLSYPGRVGHRCYRTRKRVRVYDAASMTTDPVRDRWAAGETAFAAWLTLESPASAAAVASAGFDAVVVDLQHGHATFEHLPHLLAAITRTPALPFVRAAWNHPADLMRALDLGVRGVICPMIGSRAEAEAFVAACRYPPVGTRSYGPIQAAFGRGLEQTKAAEEAILLFAMIETADGFAQPRRDRVHARARRPVRRAGRPQPRDGARHVRRLHRPCLARRARLHRRRGRPARPHRLGSMLRRHRTPSRWPTAGSGSSPAPSTRTSCAEPPRLPSSRPAPPAAPGRVSA